jgi:hypothetical protein
MVFTAASTEAKPTKVPRYEYSKIHGDRDIRLFLLDPGAFESPIKGSLITVDVYTIGDINSTNTLLGAEGYTTLSYIWGSSQTRFEVFIIAQNDGSESSLLVHQTVYEFLSHFRSPIKAQYIWIDSICICQEDNIEKQIQINLMHQIYTGSRVVAVWLGTESDKEKVRTFQGLARSIITIFLCRFPLGCLAPTRER